MTIPVHLWSKVTIHVCKECGKRFGRRVKPSETATFCSKVCAGKAGRNKITLNNKKPFDVFKELKEIWNELPRM